MQLTSRKNLLILILIITVLSIPLTIFLLRQQQETRSRAGGGEVVFTLTPESLTQPLGEEFPARIFLNGEDFDIAGVDFKLSYNKDVLEFVRFDSPATFTNELRKVHDIQTGTIHYVGVNTTRNPVRGQALDMGTATFRPKTLGTATISLQNVMVVAGGITGPVAMAALPIGTITISTPVTPIISETPTVQPSPSIIPSPLPSLTPLPTAQPSNIPPAEPSITIIPTPTFVPGDTDGNGVDVLDYNNWRTDFIFFLENRSSYNRRSDLYPIGNPDGSIDIFDFNTWRNAYLQSLGL